MSVVHSEPVENQIAGSYPKKSGEIFAVLRAQAGETLADMLKRAAQEVCRKNARVLSMTILNGRAQYDAALKRIPEYFGEVTWPITLLQSEASSPDAPVGIDIHALAGDEIALTPIRLHGRVVGNRWEDSCGKYCVLQDLRAQNVGESPAIQTQHVFDDMLAALSQAGMNFQQVYRTWFRNRDILSWYGDFNRVRTEFFNQHHVFDGLLPASTGISAGNAHHAALVAGLWAMLPKSPSTTAQVVESPLQDSACRYGSSFSRAVEVRSASHRHLTISGTASIDRGGKTVHIGDTRAQIELTMQVVEAILKARHMGWPDVVRGLAYYRHAADIGLYQQWAQAHGVTLPVLEINHTVCRDDLLYEIELDARTGA